MPGRVRMFHVKHPCYTTGVSRETMCVAVHGRGGLPLPRAPAGQLAWSTAPRRCVVGDALVEHEDREAQVVEATRMHTAPTRAAMATGAQSFQLPVRFPRKAAASGTIAPTATAPSHRSGAWEATVAAASAMAFVGCVGSSKRPTSAKAPAEAVGRRGEGREGAFAAALPETSYLRGPAGCAISGLVPGVPLQPWGRGPGSRGTSRGPGRRRCQGRRRSRGPSPRRGGRPSCTSAP